MKKKKMTQKMRYRWSVILLTIVALTLVLILVLMPHTFRTKPTETAHEVLPEPTIDEPAPSISETEPESAYPEDSEVIPMAPDSVAAKPDQIPRRIYLVIDDVGNNIVNLERFLTIDLPITYAILPGRTFSRQSLEKIVEAKKRAILHQPMEPIGSSDPGKGAILSGMGRDDVFAILSANFSGLPGITGMNNHMGSKVTGDAETMNFVMEYLANHAGFFLDSVTTATSVARETAELFDVPFVRRTSGFLDNDGEYDAIMENWKNGIALAEKYGEVVLIGHVQTDALIKVIRDTAKELIALGYTFSYIGEYPTITKS